MIQKSKSAYRTIAEVAQEIGVATHVLRFWETKFKEISPMKSSNGRRYYRPDDVELIKLIRDFLYEKRYTIEGVKKIFKEKGVKAFLNEEIQKDFFNQEDGKDASDAACPEKESKISSDQIHLLKDVQEILCGLKSELTELLNG